MIPMLSWKINQRLQCRVICSQFVSDHKHQQPQCCHLLARRQYHGADSKLLERSNSGANCAAVHHEFRTRWRETEAETEVWAGQKTHKEPPQRKRTHKDIPERTSLHFTSLCSGLCVQCVPCLKTPFRTLFTFGSEVSTVVHPISLLPTTTNYWSLIR